MDAWAPFTGGEVWLLCAQELTVTRLILLSGGGQCLHRGANTGFLVALAVKYVAEPLLLQDAGVVLTGPSCGGEERPSSKDPGCLCSNP